MIMDDIITDNTSIDNVPTNKTFTKKSIISFKITIILLVCLSGLGLNFCQDSPYSMQDEIMSIININTIKYDMLLSFVAIPNIFMAICGGLIVDYCLDLGSSLVLFTFCVCIGQCIFLLGCYYKLFWLMLLGRAIFGLSSESVQVAINKYAGMYLKGKLMVLFFSCLQLFSKSAEFSNMFFMHDLFYYIHDKFPYYKNNQILGATFGLGLIVCLFSTLCAIILAVIDRHFLSYRLYNIDDNELEDFNLKDIFIMPTKLWLLCAICALSYSATSNYNSLSVTLYSEKYLFTPTLSSKLQGWYIMVAIIVSPILGAISNYIGFDALILFFVFLLASICYNLLAFSFPPIFSVIIPYGLSSAIRNVMMWPMVVYLVPRSRLGTAYGLIQSAQNVFLSFTPIISGYISQHFGMMAFTIFLSSMLHCSVILLIILCFLDSIDPNGMLLVSYKKRPNSFDLTS